MDDKTSRHEGTDAERAEGLGGDQEQPSDVDEEGGKGARLDQAAPTPEKKMERGDTDNPRTSTGTSPTPGHSVQGQSEAGEQFDPDD